VQLKARYSDFTTKTRATTLPEPSDATQVVRDTARHLLENQLDRRGRPLRLIGISTRNFATDEPLQQELFPDQSAVRDREIDGLMDEAVDRWGRSALTRGVHRRDPGSREGHQD
jgi:DNA polymerase-4